MEQSPSDIDAAGKAFENAEQELDNEVAVTEVERALTGVEQTQIGEIKTIISEEVPEVYRTSEPGWIEVSTKQIFSDRVAPAKAKKEVQKNLYNEAIQKKCPTSVQITSLLTDVITDESEQTAWSGFFRTTLTGMITAQEVVREEINWLESGGYEVDMILKAYVVPVKGNRDPGFQLDVDLKDNLLKAGDEAIIRVKCSKDAYLYAFNLMADNNVMMIFPNEYLTDNFVPSGTKIEIPSEKERNMGIHLRVAPMPDEEFTSESVYVVATKQPIPGLDKLPKISDTMPIFDANSRSFVDFQRWLTNISLDQRVEKAVVYHVTQ